MSTTLCSRCGGIVRIDRGSCPACGATRLATATAEFVPAPVSVLRREDMAILIRSRVMWGDDPTEIRTEFVKQGARAGEVDGLLRTAIQKRKDYYRKLGVKNVIGGGAALLVGGLILFTVHLFFSGAGGRLPIWFLFAAVALPVGGILLVAKGVRRMRRPGEGESTAHGHPDED